jgi:hypothetical protein
MGAGVAASPHCPVRLVTKPGRRGSPLGGFEDGTEPGLGPGSSGVLPELALLPVSPRAPRQGRSPGGSPLGRPGTESSGSRQMRCRSRGSVPPLAGRPRPKPWPCPDSPGPGSRPALCAVPGRNPVLPDGSGPKSLSAGRQRADSRPAFRRTGTDRNPFPSLVPNPKVQDLGRFTKPATLASAKGQARSFRMAAASSAARAFARPPLCLVGQEAASLRLWLGRRSTVAGRMSRPRPIAVMKNDSVQADSGCG